MPESNMEARRKFLKTFAFCAVSSTLLDRSWLGIYAAEIQLAASSLGRLRLRVSDFPALQTEGGSVRLAINPLRGNPPNGPMPNGQFYPVIVNRGPSNQFFAVNSRCTHQNCAVDPLDGSSSTMTCPCHFSVFAIDGRRLSGLATSSLGRYTTTFDGDNTVEIQIPGLGYSVVASNLQEGTGGKTRLKLEFRSFRNTDYEIQFRESLEKEAVIVPFSSTPDGIVDQNAFTAATTANVSLYVDRTASAGFYTVAIRLSEG